MKKEDIDTNVNKFLLTTSLRELADCLEIKYSILTYYLYVLKEDDKYREFEIKKRNGGVRKIIAPIPGLNHIQANLNTILQNIYPAKKCVHGFTLKKDIKSNAISHLKKR